MGKVEFEDAALIFDRVEKDGVAVSSVSDGWVFGFTDVVLEKLLQDARESEKRAVMLFVRKQGTPA